MSVALLAAVLWHQVDSETHADETSKREYWFSSDPAEVLLIVRFMGGRSAHLHVNTIFGDGRYEHKITDHTGQHVYEQRDLQLSLEEVTALLNRAVHAGLMEFDQETIEQRMRASQPPHHVFDAVTMFLDINLERYRGPGKTEAIAASKKMSCRAIDAEARIFPEIEEIQALLDIAKKLNEFKRRAGEKQEQ